MTRTPERAPRRHDGPAVRQEGFALVTVLLALVGLSALAAGGLMIADSRTDAVRNERVATEAYYTAEAGLNRYLSGHRGLPAQRTYGVGGASARVEATRLFDLGDNRYLTLVESRGSSSGQAGTVRRTTGALAVLHSDFSDLDFPASVTATQGFHQNGNAATYSGYDACSSEAVAGIAVGAGTYSQNPPLGGGGGDPIPEGEPDVREMTQAEMQAALGLDWASLRSGAALSADVVLCGAGSPAGCVPSGGGWPSSSGSDDYPVIRNEGDHSLTGASSGRGVLIVEGDLSVTGNPSWEGMIVVRGDLDLSGNPDVEGVVLVGDAVTGNGNPSVTGAAATGLNALLGETVSASSGIGNGTPDFQYDSCVLSDVSDRLAERTMKLYELSDTWFETF